MDCALGLGICLPAWEKLDYVHSGEEEKEDLGRVHCPQEAPKPCEITYLFLFEDTGPVWVMVFHPQVDNLEGQHDRGKMPSHQALRLDVLQTGFWALSLHSSLVCFFTDFEREGDGGGSRGRKRIYTGSTCSTEPDMRLNLMTL